MGAIHTNKSSSWNSSEASNECIISVLYLKLCLHNSLKSFLKKKHSNAHASKQEVDVVERCEDRTRNCVYIYTHTNQKYH